MRRYIIMKRKQVGNFVNHVGAHPYASTNNLQEENKNEKGYYR